MIAHQAWKLCCRSAHRRLHAALASPRAAQEHVLRSLLQKNSASTFGRLHRLDARMTVADYQAHVPVSTYEDLRPLIDRAASGEPNVLTCEPVLMFETSSGSTSAAKLIPYTASLRAEFQEAIRAWMYDLYSHHPGIARGRHYWSITPLHRTARKTPGGIPIGFEDDAEYLGVLERWLARRMFAVPSAVGKLSSMEACLSATRDHLRQAQDLSFISVWSPSFLEMLLDGMPESPATLWPNLTVLSCWGDAASRSGFAALQGRLPGVTLQRKGLLATEGVMTIPWHESGGHVPCLNSHFYEFFPAGGDTSSPALLCDELTVGQEYNILLTTGGGLYRYRIGDRVRCVGTFASSPLFEFVGKEDGVSDLHGEKLHAIYVGEALEHARRVHQLGPVFLMLAPADDGRGYVLFAGCTPKETFTLCETVDGYLMNNPHYRYCRHLGQLRRLRIVIISEGAATRYLQRCVSLGQRPGDVKLTALHREPGWEAWMSSPPS